MKSAVDLNFPVFSGKPLPPSIRSLDEINQWIEEVYPSFFNRETYEREKRLFTVNLPFRL